MAAKGSANERADQSIADGLHNDVVTVREDGSVAIDPPGENIFDCP